MKQFLRIALVIVLALVLTVQTPLQALAQAAQTDGPDYISEVKVFMGGSAESELTAEGFIPLKGDDGNPVDLNQGAEGGSGSPGKKKVLLGYKTTKLQSEAITDLAVMNMNGGYSVKDYELLMKKYMGAQISPFIDRFLVAINEYRENLKSDDDVNRNRAEYIRKALNKFTDDDCAGAGLGDLLVNETVYEMAKPKFDKLSEKDKEELGISGVNEQVRDAIPEAEKNRHCDLLTLFAQADGQLLLMIYDLITRGADTNEDSWMDRFAATSYEELLESYEMPEEDALQQMARDFEDDARLLLKNWEKLRTVLAGAEEDAITLESMTMPDVDGLKAKLESLKQSGASAEEIENAAQDLVDAQTVCAKMIELNANVALAEYLENIDYGDGTMFDYFTQSGSELSKNPEVLFPLIASLSDGQRAGAEFISLRELIMLSNRETEYSDGFLDVLQKISVYAGVDRGIYQKGGVALTSDTLRTQALEREKNLAERSTFGIKSYVMWGLTAASLIGFGVSLGYGLTKTTTTIVENVNGALPGSVGVDGLPVRADELATTVVSSGSSTALWMSAGFALAACIFAGLSILAHQQELKEFYDVDLEVIPHYMVDEASITYYNEKGEQMVDIDYAAYYKAVTCNRSTSDKNYKALTDCADLNGDVGQQWVALYACRDNEAMPPILADSLKAVVDSTGVPAGYSKGIHMFGSDSAFNMNNKLYVWEQKAKPIFVYYKLDLTAPLREPTTTGAAFSGGTLALAGVGGLGIGALVTALSMTARRKKKQPAA